MEKKRQNILVHKKAKNIRAKNRETVSRKKEAEHLRGKIREKIFVQRQKNGTQMRKNSLIFFMF